MTIYGILTVVWYSALPWLWLIALMAAIFLVPQFLARMKGYTFSSKGGMGSKYIPPLVFVLALFLVPMQTQSSIAYVNTWVDWMNLIGVSIGLAIYTWLVFHPVCYMRNSKA